MWFALIPYCYFIKTRLNMPLQQVSWFLVYFVPILIICVVYDFDALPAIFLAYYIVNFVYENGYIQNDILTSRKELEPTRRLSKLEGDILYRNIHKVFLFRIIVLFALLFVLYFFSRGLYFCIFVFLLFVLQILFVVYNSFRNRVNFYLILPMSYLRFYLPVLPLLLINHDYSEALALFFVYPFAKFLEFSRETKFNFTVLPRVVGHIDRFRVRYYFFVSFVFLIIFYFTSYMIDASFFVAIYYFLYRVFGFLVYSNSADFKSLVNSGAKKEFRE